MRSGLLVAMADAAGGVYVAGQAEPARLDRWYEEYVAGKPKREFPSATARSWRRGMAISFCWRSFYWSWR